MGLKQTPKVYIDTNLFIYYFENNPTYANKVENCKYLYTSDKKLKNYKDVSVIAA